MTFRRRGRRCRRREGRAATATSPMRSGRPTSPTARRTSCAATRSTSTRRWPIRPTLPLFASSRVSQYDSAARSGTINRRDADAAQGTYHIRQKEVNPPNLPMFVNGTAAFLGDYIDVRGPDHRRDRRSRAAVQVQRRRHRERQVHDQRPRPGLPRRVHRQSRRHSAARRELGHAHLPDHGTSPRRTGKTTGVEFRPTCGARLRRQPQPERLFGGRRRELGRVRQREFEAARSDTRRAASSSPCRT